MMLLRDETHLLFLNSDLWFAERREFHETRKNNPTAESRYFVDLLFGDKREVRLEYDNAAARDATWAKIAGWFEGLAR
jgi:hypothetical protein